MTQSTESLGRVPATSEDVVVRRGRLADLDRVLAIAASLPTAANWPIEAYRTFCEPEIDELPQVAKLLLVACLPKTQEIAGFAAFQVIFACGECGLENMAVAENWRRRRIARRLLAAGQLWCRGWCGAAATEDSFQAEPGGSLWLEVRASNLAAISLYRQAGFAQVGRRTDYYTNPTEDALQMSKSLSPHGRR